ncbi:hypothetical protein QTO34_000597 [Cnephaeus nilssonii]|uniref:L1 transposable element RRM domain-containing protein n=1 Tax=Cnephaeus nilssonii TaxID=3371016 RepID=A0AA40ICS0_CNENI|nr:hypothetical protein QTO34_000597 [Eptesicus nilssonii]
MSNCWLSHEGSQIGEGRHKLPTALNSSFGRDSGDPDSYGEKRDCLPLGQKHTNIRIMGVPEEEREQNIENLLEKIMTENFPYLVKEIDLQVQEAQRTPNKRNPKRTTPRHIIIKMSRAKDKERILKAAREKQLPTSEYPYDCQLISQQKLCRQEGSGKKYSKLLYPEKLSFRIEGHIKSFTDKKKLKEFITTKPGLYEMLKDIRIRETMGRQRNSPHRKKKQASPEKEVNELDANNLSEKEFREMVIRWLKRMEDKFDNMSKNQEEMKKNQEEMKNDIAAVKNSIESIKSRLEEAEDRISELEDKMEKNTQLQQLLETKIRKHEESLRELWDNTKQNNIRIIGVPEGKETEQGIENLLEEIITENFPDIGKKKPTKSKKLTEFQAK